MRWSEHAKCYLDIARLNSSRANNWPVLSWPHYNSVQQVNKMHPGGEITLLSWLSKLSGNLALAVLCSPMPTWPSQALSKGHRVTLSHWLCVQRAPDAPTHPSATAHSWALPVPGEPVLISKSNKTKVHQPLSETLLSFLLSMLSYFSFC
jgi:hypothetical protein